MGEVPQIIPGATGFPRPSLDLSSPEIHVRRRSEQAADMGVTTEELGYTVDALIDGAYATDYYIGGDKVDLTIVGNKEFANKTQDLGALAVATPSGNLVRLESIADVQLSGGPEQIQRRERQRAITISVTPPNDVPLEAAIDAINESVVQPRLDSGELGGEYRIVLAGTADKLLATWNALRWNFVLALLVTYLLMAALFESWLYPFVIILSVPLGAVGGFVGLALLNAYLMLWPYGEIQTLDVLTMLGFVILIGTVVNNPILIVHQSLNHMREEGMAHNEAILASVRNRVRPIFMTTTTTVLGLAPLVLFPGSGAELYRGLGAVVLSPRRGRQRVASGEEASETRRNPRYDVTNKNGRANGLHHNGRRPRPHRSADSTIHPPPMPTNCCRRVRGSGEGSSPTMGLRPWLVRL
jgi:HAE1 family hydrophobic/amphiphilic exporter-1